MYEQVETEKNVVGEGGWQPIATLKDEYGGVTHIVEDDGCYILLNGSDDTPYKISAWIYSESFEVLRRLPPPSGARVKQPDNDMNKYISYEGMPVYTRKVDADAGVCTVKVYAVKIVEVLAADYLGHYRLGVEGRLQTVTVSDMWWAAWNPQPGGYYVIMEGSKTYESAEQFEGRYALATSTLKSRGDMPEGRDGVVKPDARIDS